jgi:hypothetical protein
MKPDTDYKDQFWIDTEGKIYKWKGTKKERGGIISFHHEIAEKILPDART